MAAAIPALIGGFIGLIGHAQKQAHLNRQANLIEQDAARRQQEFNLQALDFTREGAYRESQQNVSYSRSGVLLSGSALTRLGQTRSRTHEGARRLRDRGAYEVERGDMLADITRRSAGSPLGAFFGGFFNAFQSFGGVDQAAGFFGGLFPQQGAAGLGGGGVPRLSAVGGVPNTRSIGSFTY